uniref:60s acidic ribosomal protein n=1 Tax=Solanum tuberosum TaxID=4113 RepID=M1AAF6_SOLTU
MLLGSCSHNKLFWLVILNCDTCLLVLVVHFELTLDIHAAVGAEADDDRIQLLLSQVKGKDITELIAAGREKLASVPAGGGAACAVAAPGGGGAAAPAAAEKKEEKKVEEKEESDDDMGFSLFD